MGAQLLRLIESRKKHPWRHTDIEASAILNRALFGCVLRSNQSNFSDSPYRLAPIKFANALMETT
jgi:hypothetical protein